MKEKLQEYALIAEIIGGIGIIASLIFVGLQVQQNADETALNTRQMQAMAFQDLSKEIINLNKLVISSPDIANLRVKMNSDEELSPAENLQIIALYRSLFRLGDTAFTQYSNGIISESQLISILVPVFGVTDTKLGNEIWSSEVGVTESFRNYFNSEKSNK